MKEDVRLFLINLNREFYRQFSLSFAETRKGPQPGFTRLLEYISPEDHAVLDVGCGEGRFGRYLLGESRAIKYTGIDYTESLLDYARINQEGTFLVRDISEPGCLDNLGRFDVIACLATLQHIPGHDRRGMLLKEMSSHLAESGRILLSNWQFLTSERQRRKIVNWSEVGLTRAEVAGNDYLLSWHRDGRGVRYVAYLDLLETGRLASLAGLRLREHFYSDGREGNLNLYTILA